MRSSLVAAFCFFAGAAVLSSVCSGYHQGGDEIMCWVDGTPLSECPPNLSVKFEDQARIPLLVEAETRFGVTVDVSILSGKVGADENIAQIKPVEKAGAFWEISHVNLHACQNKFGWCTPFASRSSELVTDTQEEQSNTSMPIDLNMELPEGSWTVILHARIFVAFTNAPDSIVKLDVAAGGKLKAYPAEVALVPKDSVVIAVKSVIGAVFALITFIVCALLYYRKHYVVRIADPTLCIQMCVGGAIAASSAITFLPDLTDSKCTARVWLLLIGFDLVFIPLLLKTWRIHKLFNNKALKKIKITTRRLLTFLCAVLVGDAAFGLTWYIAYPLHATREYDEISEYVYEMWCVGDHQDIFQTLALVSRVIPLIFITQLAYRVRTAFEFADFHVKIDRFDESSAIVLILLNMLVVSLFCVALQFLLDGAPDALLAMRAFGVLWTVAFTLTTLFVPKILTARRLPWDGSEEDKRISRRPVSGARFVSKTSEEIPTIENSMQVNPMHSKAASASRASTSITSLRALELGTVTKGDAQ